MDVVAMLEAAALLVPQGAAGEGDVTVADVWDCLAHDEWEVALGLLEELGQGWTAPAGFWEELGRAAAMLGLARSEAWCRWREYEDRAGVVRAQLTLEPVGGSSFRRTPMPGAGVMRPLWDIGSRRPDGAPDLHVACMWVEYAHELAPGERAVVRLLPLTPERWRHLAPGDRIALHETAVPGGTGTVLEVRPPSRPGAPSRRSRE
ncbi:hypothetical protein [Streptomyces sp. NRRL S-378]|uniref:hypothetical protein n=1 Tax=Streptomyces sp. NRRL S-378 TaxID=1463904 RepID=UPI0004CB2D3C|nr:hypothetical protein [Streptomyces sp. NRRL S-378]